MEFIILGLRTRHKEGIKKRPPWSVWSFSFNDCRKPQYHKTSSGEPICLFIGQNLINTCRKSWKAMSVATNRVESSLRDKKVNIRRKLGTTLSPRKERRSVQTGDKKSQACSLSLNPSLFRNRILLEWSWVGIAMLLTAKSPRNDSKIDILLFCPTANLQLSLLFSSQSPKLSSYLKMLSCQWRWGWWSWWWWW